MYDLKDLYDLQNVYELAHAAGSGPRNLHDSLSHTFPEFGYVFYTYTAVQRIIAACQDLEDLQITICL